MSAERTDFVDVMPINSVKTLLMLVKGQQVAAKDAGLAIENVASYAMGQFLPANPVMFHQGMEAHAELPVSREECQNSLEAVIDAHEKKTPGMKASADQVGKVDWKNILTTVLPFLLKLLI